jgi:hypothetical protein
MKVMLACNELKERGKKSGMMEGGNWTGLTCLRTEDL